MADFLGNIYGWFQSLFGQDLSYYLWGYNPETGGYTNPNMYNHVGLIAIIVAMVLVLVYYYIINHPRFCKWWSWLLTLILNGLIGLFVGYGIVASKYVNRFIPRQLMYQFDADGNVIAYLIGYQHCWGFGIANMIISTMFFVLFTFMIKWWSSNAKHVPFL